MVFHFSPFFQASRLLSGNWPAGLLIVCVLLSLITCWLIWERSQWRKQTISQIVELQREITLQQQNAEVSAHAARHARQLLREKNQELGRMNQELAETIRVRSEELKNTYLRLVASDRDFDNFIYRASHDLKGPLTTLIGLCNVTSLDVKDETALKYFHLFAVTVKKMDYLLAKLLRMNEIKRNRVKRQEIYFLPLIRRTIDSIEKKEDTQYIDWQLQIAPDLNFYSDYTLLEIILENLLRNAVQNRVGTATLQSVIGVSVRSSDHQQLTVVVWDNGTGIPMAYAEKIFEMFFKVPERGEGTGLGLYVVKLAVEKLEGNISLTKHAPGETIFEVRLPYKFV